MSSSPSSRRSRPTSAPSVDDAISVSSAQMQRSSSADQNRISKRKGTRSVSTLTPAQLARKRANDREAQRAIRARTKDHIERLEAELDELRSDRQRDHTVQELMRQNRRLEEELKTLRESMGISFGNSSPYSTPGAMNHSPRTSPYPSGDFAAAAAAAPPTAAPMPADYASGYVPFAAANPNPNSCENWAATVSASVPSNVSSPCSSTDEYGAGPAYLPTSAPNPMVQSPATSGLRGHEDIKIEYEDGNDHGFRLENHHSATGSNSGAMSQPFMLPPQNHPGAWGPNSAVYYTSMPHPVY